jgi:hypothetical protein
MRRLFRLTVLVGVFALWTIGVASATHVAPTLISGNPTCEEGQKIEPVASGTFGSITITVNNTPQGQTFDFTVSGGVVTGVLVKGGPNAHFYDYAALGGVSSDTGLHSPNRTSTRFYGLSHLCFFEDDKKPPPPPK